MPSEARRNFIEILRAKRKANEHIKLDPHVIDWLLLQLDKLDELENLQDTPPSGYTCL